MPSTLTSPTRPTPSTTSSSSSSDETLRRQFLLPTEDDQIAPWSDDYLDIEFVVNKLLVPWSRDSSSSTLPLTRCSSSIPNPKREEAKRGATKRHARDSQKEMSPCTVVSSSRGLAFRLPSPLKGCKGKMGEWMRKCGFKSLRSRSYDRV